MLTVKTFKRLIDYRTNRNHLGHYSQNDKSFNGIEDAPNTYGITPDNIELQKIDEGNGNWHNKVKVCK